MKVEKDRDDGVDEIIDKIHDSAIDDDNKNRPGMTSAKANRDL